MLSTIGSIAGSKCNIHFQDIYFNTEYIRLSNGSSNAASYMIQAPSGVYWRNLYIENGNLYLEQFQDVTLGRLVSRQESGGNSGSLYFRIDLEFTDGSSTNLLYASCGTQNNAETKNLNLFPYFNHLFSISIGVKMPKRLIFIFDGSAYTATQTYLASKINYFDFILK